MKKLILIICFLFIAIDVHAALSASQKAKMRQYFNHWIIACQRAGTLNQRVNQLFNLLSEANEEAVFNIMKADIQNDFAVLEAQAAAPLTSIQTKNQTIITDLDAP